MKQYSLTTQEKNRYSRHVKLSMIGEDGQLKLKAAKVLVIGAGGLGCPVLQYLVAAGVGTIGVIDMDRVEESNLQRQVLYTTEDIGTYKAQAAKRRLEGLNPLIQINAYTEELSTQNALELINQYDLIVDGSDNFATRYLVSDACVLLNKILVYGSIFKFEGQVAVFNYNGSATYRCLFPKPPKVGTVPSCGEVGVLGVLPSIIGSMQANECLKLILEIGQPLINKLLIYNSLDNSSLMLDIKKQQNSQRPQTRKDFQQMDYPVFCGMNSLSNSTISEITAQALRQNTTDYTIVDVREIYEQPRPSALAGLNIPLPRLLTAAHQIPKDEPVVVICHKGIRSRIAIEKLQNERGYTNLINLKGGILSWMELE